jgi:hypothetical protein
LHRDEGSVTGNDVIFPRREKELRRKKDETKEASKGATLILITKAAQSMVSPYARLDMKRYDWA